MGWERQQRSLNNNCYGGFKCFDALSRELLKLISNYQISCWKWSVHVFLCICGCLCLCACCLLSKKHKWIFFFSNLQRTARLRFSPSFVFNWAGFEMWTKISNKQQASTQNTTKIPEDCPFSKLPRIGWWDVARRFSLSPEVIASLFQTNCSCRVGLPAPLFLASTRWRSPLNQRTNI